MITPLDENLFVTLNSWPAHSIYHGFRKISKNELLLLETNKETPIILEICWHLPGLSLANRKTFEGYGSLPSSEDELIQSNNDDSANSSKLSATVVLEGSAASKAFTTLNIYQRSPRAPASKVYIPTDMDVVYTTMTKNSDTLDNDMSWHKLTSKHANKDKSNHQHIVLQDFTRKPQLALHSRQSLLPTFLAPYGNNLYPNSNPALTSSCDYRNYCTIESQSSRTLLPPIYPGIILISKHSETSI